MTTPFSSCTQTFFRRNCQITASRKKTLTDWLFHTQKKAINSCKLVEMENNPNASERIVRAGFPISSSFCFISSWESHTFFSLISFHHYRLLASSLSLFLELVKILPSRPESPPEKGAREMFSLLVRDFRLKSKYFRSSPQSTRHDTKELMKLFSSLFIIKTRDSSLPLTRVWLVSGVCGEALTFTLI